MVRLIPLLKRVFFCPKIQREALGRPPPAYPRRPVYRTPCNPSVGAGFYPARSSAPHVTSRRGDPCSRPLRRTTCNPPVGAGGCPPSCQPTDGHCRTRQSGHFLEIGSLLPPLAALRRFPRRPVYRTPCNPSVGAGFYPARSSALLVTDAGRCGHRPLRNPIGKHSVGADASVRPSIPYRTPCKNPVIAKPVRTLAVAIRIPRPLGPLA